MDIKKYFTQKKYVVFIAIICCILWGSAFPVLKTSYVELKMVSGDMAARIVFAGMRFFIASIILFLILKVVIKEKITIDKTNFMKFSILGIMQTTLQYFFFYNGLDKTTGMKGAVLASAATFFVVIIAHIVYTDDKINYKKIIGLISGFCGIIIINWGKGIDFNFSFWGEGFLLISSFVASFGTIYAKKLSKSKHPFLVTAYQMFIGSILLLIIGIPQLNEGAISFTFKGWILLIYAAFLSAIAFSLWYSLLKYNKAGEISLYKFMIPVSGSILSAIFIPGESFGIKALIALVLVVMGIAVVNYTPTKIENVVEKRTYK